MAWGIFMLILLLGAGNGLKNGVASLFGASAKNTMYLGPGYTSMPYKGLAKERRVKLDEEDDVLLKQQFASISHYSPMIDRGSGEISYGKEYVSNGLRGVMPDYAFIRNMEIRTGNGRFINEADVREFRKVMVIHRQTADILFRGESPLGKYVLSDHVAYQVIGIYEDEELEQRPDVCVPLTTLRRIYGSSEGYNRLLLAVEGLNTLEANEQFEGDVRQKIAIKHNFDVADGQAMWIWNRLRDYMQTMGIFNGISLFVWVIGIGTLVAGVVGVSNIMLITVKERTREFGIRKALGATPFSILKLIVLEALLITGFFGYIGMVAGVGLTELVGHWMTESGSEMDMFKNPTVELPVVFSATLILIVAGVLAGYFPARKAVRIKPIEALRYE